jgi:hypothetical protein
MLREAQIPLALWVSAAILVHLAGGGGAVEVARVVEEREEVRSMVEGIREGLRADTTFEILTTGVEPTPPAVPPKPPENPPESDDKKPDDAKDKALEKKPEKEAPKPKPRKLKLPPKLPLKPLAELPKKPEVKKPEPPKATPPPPPPPPPPPIAKVEPVKPVAPPPPPPPAEKRLAVRQHVQKDQEDNPNAKRIADDANTVQEETMARVRVHDHDEADPTAGSGAGAKDDQPGNAAHNKTAQSEDKRGNRDNAPGEAAQRSTSAEHHNPAPPAPAAAMVTKSPPQSMPGSRGGGAGPVQRQAPAEASPGAAGGSGPAAPEVANSGSGSWRIDPANPGGDGKSRVAGARRSPTPFSPPITPGALGFGAPGIPGGPNLNLTPGGLEAAVGSDQLKRERAADGEARKTAHRGSSDMNKFQRLKGAIENYDPSVKPGNQTALNAARVPFASYINGIHNRIHPIFAEEFLSTLENLPAGHQLNQDLVTHVEIVLSKDEGRIVRLGVTRGSGSTAFDAVAINSISRASPFGQAPDVIVSPDGNVYLHWEFHRDPFDACTTRNARPFLLKSAPPSKTTPRLPLPKGSSDDRREAPPPLLPLRQP